MERFVCIRSVTVRMIMVIRDGFYHIESTIYSGVHCMVSFTIPSSPIYVVIFSSPDQYNLYRTVHTYYVGGGK